MQDNFTFDDFEKGLKKHVRKIRRSKPTFPFDELLSYAVTGYTKNSYRLTPLGERIVGNARQLVDANLESLTKLTFLYLVQPCSTDVNVIHVAKNQISRQYYGCKNNIIEETINSMELKEDKTKHWKEQFLFTLMAIAAITKADEKKYAKYDRKKLTVECLLKEDVLENLWRDEYYPFIQQNSERSKLKQKT